MNTDRRPLAWPTLAMSRNAHPITTAALDRAIAQYLPASPRELRALIAERTGTDPAEWADVDTVSEALVMLADLDHNVDQSSIRAY